MTTQQAFEVVKNTLHIMRTEDRVDNSYGKTTAICNCLSQIAVADLTKEERTELKQMCRFMKENPLIFGIPEKWLVQRTLEMANKILNTGG